MIQGIGGGLIIPVGQAMMFRTYPPERRARAQGMVALGTALGPATGPVLGGILTTELSWRWCFFVNIPFGTAALVIGLLFLAEHREPAAGRLDIGGFVLAGGGLALFLYALSEAPVRGWTSPVIVVTGVISLAALAGLVVLELRLKAPMLNLRLLRNRIFRTTSLVSLCQGGGYNGYLFIMPEFLQEARGASALSSGLTTFPGAIGLLISAQIAARLYYRIGPRRMAVGGLCGVFVAWTLIGLTVGLDTNIWLIRVLAFSSGPPAAGASSPSRPRRSRPSPRPTPAAPRRCSRPRTGSRAGSAWLCWSPSSRPPARRGHRRRADPLVPLRLPHRRRGSRRRHRDRADHPGRRRRRHHAPPGAHPGPRAAPGRGPAGDRRRHRGHRVARKNAGSAPAPGGPPLDKRICQDKG